MRVGETSLVALDDRWCSREPRDTLRVVCTQDRPTRSRKRTVVASLERKRERDSFRLSGRADSLSDAPWAIDPSGVRFNSPSASQRHSDHVCHNTTLFQRYIRICTPKIYPDTYSPKLRAGRATSLRLPLESRRSSSRSRPTAAMCISFLCNSGTFPVSDSDSAQFSTHSRGHVSS